jgi:tetratricopeptide (TPR) repeat protein
MRRHPTRDLLRQFLVDELADDAAEEVQGHVERGCVSCLFTMRELMAHTEPDLFANLLRFCNPAIPAEERLARFDRAVRQTFYRALTVGGERRLGPTLLAELERRPAAARREAIRTALRYQLFGFADYLAEESRQAGFRDVVRAQELAELGVEVADVLDPSIYLPAVVQDRRALNRAFLGNARRVASDLFGADRAFEEARFHLEHGSDSEIVRGEVLSLLGSLRIDQTRYPEAFRVLEEALGLFRQIGQRQDEGKVLLKLAIVHGYAGEPERSVEVLVEAKPIIDEDGHERHVALARHGLSWWLVEAGDPLEALAIFEKARPHYDRFQDDPWFQLRRTWQEARIYAALGDATRAEPLFDDARHTATERELPYELAMINLELAIFHLNQGDTAKVHQLAEEMAPIFRSRDLHAHAMAAIYLFQHAARTQTATAGLAKEVLLYLRRAQNNPYLRFG